MVHARAEKRSALARIFRFVHEIAYQIWLGLLAVRLALLIALVLLLLLDMFINRAHAQPSANAVGNGAQIARIELDDILHNTSARDISTFRGNCATGRAAATRAQIRAAGINGAAVGAWCVTALTRSGRDGTLGYVRDPNAQGQQPAQSFDDGFVGGYFAHEVLPAAAPAMTTLLPIADRCLSQAEPNIKLCDAAGHILGARAASGETIALR